MYSAFSQLRSYKAAPSQRGVSSAQHGPQISHTGFVSARKLPKLKLRVSGGVGLCTCLPFFRSESAFVLLRLLQMELTPSVSFLSISLSFFFIFRLLIPQVVLHQDDLRLPHFLFELLRVDSQKHHFIFVQLQQHACYFPCTLRVDLIDSRIQNFSNLLLPSPRICLNVLVEFNCSGTREASVCKV